MVYYAVYYHDYERHINFIILLNMIENIYTLLNLILFVKPDNTKKLFFYRFVIKINYPNKAINIHISDQDLS